MPALDLYDRNWPIWTYAEITPPAKFVHDEDGRRGMATSSLVSGGCIISGAGSTSRCCSPACTRIPTASSTTWWRCPTSRSAAARLSKVVIDRGVEIPPGLVVGEDPDADARRFRRTDKGVCLITQPMIDRLQS